MSTTPLWRRLLERAGARRTPPALDGALSSVEAEFERTYGGFAVPQGWTFGIAASAAFERMKGRTPVGHHEDVVAYLDAAGAGYVMDTLEDAAPRKVAPHPQALVTGILLWSAHHRQPKERTRTFAGKQGKKIAAQLSLSPLADSMVRERWWGDEKAWVVERGEVTLVGVDGEPTLLVQLDAALEKGSTKKAPSKKASTEKAIPTKTAKGPASGEGFPNVTSPEQLPLELAREDVSLGSFVSKKPEVLRQRLTAPSTLEALRATVVEEASTGASLSLPDGVSLVVSIGRMGKGSALYARLRGPGAESLSDAVYDLLTS